MYAVVTFLLPRLDLILREGNVVKRLLYPTEKCFKNSPRNGWTFRSVVGPKCYPFGVLPSLPSQGVAGILLLTDAVNIATVTQGFRMFTCKDPFVSRVAWASLQTVVGREMGGGQTNARTNDGESQRKCGRKSRNSRKMAETFNPATQESERLREKLLKQPTSDGHGDAQGSPDRIPQPTNQPDVARIHPLSRKNLQGLPRKAVRAAHIFHLICALDQRKVFGFTSRWSTSNPHFFSLDLFSWSIIEIQCHKQWFICPKQPTIFYQREEYCMLIFSISERYNVMLSRDDVQKTKAYWNDCMSTTESDGSGNRVGCWTTETTEL